MRQTSSSLLWCFLLALTSHCTPSLAADAEPTPKQRLLDALKVCQSSQAVLSVAGHTHTFSEGKLQSGADFTIMLPINGSGSRKVLAYTPWVSLSSSLHMEDNLKATFNGRYWTKINYSRGLSGSPHSMDKTIEISKDAHPIFAHQYRMGLQLCLPLVSFKETNGSFGLLKLLEGYRSLAYTITEEKREKSPVLKVSLGSDEWVTLDPARNYVVLEYVVSGKDWREEAHTLKVERTSSGLWFATDFIYKYTVHGKERLRYETQINNVTLEDQAALEKELEPRYGRGWKVKDERTKQEYLIQDDAKAVFEKLDAVAP